MSFKFEIIGTALVVTDTTDATNYIDVPAGDMYFNYKELKKGIVAIYDTNDVNMSASWINKYNLAECVDSGLVAFTEETFRTWASTNLSLVGGSASGGAPPTANAQEKTTLQVTDNSTVTLLANTINAYQVIVLDGTASIDGVDYPKGGYELSAEYGTKLTNAVVIDCTNSANTIINTIN